MLTLVLQKQKQRKYVFSLIVFFVLFSLIYYLLDYLNGGYVKMKNDYGIYLVIINILLNIFMSALSAFMFNLSKALVDLNSKEGKGTFMTSISVLFGILTYGCTSCVIAFFTAIGITFAVAVLPLAGLPYKLISLVLLLIGFIWLIKEIKTSKCKI
ncbi:MAG: hypothetical protein PHD47_00575 [Acholeplasmataceae bacterium]|nr:hypothetical protein [Acholeplasmataceae bacterium]